jgi:adenosylcobinamide-phosphate synthase
LPTIPVALGLALGVAVDAAIGDPRRRHPVAGFGRCAAYAETHLYGDDVRHGAWFVGAVTAPVVMASLTIDHLLRTRPALRTAVIAAATWAVLGGTTLARVGGQMSDLLLQHETREAQELLRSLCGRDPATLDDAGLARASIESVAENTSDAAVAPLVWGAIAGLPGLVTYRAVNTLDAMVGHRSPRYARFGTVAARLDDAANLLPARLTATLTVLAASSVQGSSRGGWQAWRHDARRHPSPNAGPCEAAAAGVLGVQLGGITVYDGRVEQRPQLGSGPAPRVEDIRRAVRLSRVAQWSAAALCVAAAGLRGRAR